MFFCGHHEECTPFNTEGALQRAKRAVEQHYAVVGVLEDLNSTLSVLEKYIPKFFDGATDVYYSKWRILTNLETENYKLSLLILRLLPFQ